ncbi:MAG: cysteine desulfurase [Clostridia bacterium]|nr:cysteine desulfurase [Clostridia bacterium]
MEHITYLDNSATTKPCKTACEYISRALCENWGNPSSLHTLGMYAEEAVTSAREAVAKFISARSDEIVFTGSGTEANNTALMTVANSRNKKIITTQIEHPSVLETVKRLEAQGFEVVRIGCDSEGVIDLKALEASLDGKTAMVSVMLVNNEIGTVQPVAEAVRIVKKIAPNALFHCDAVQGFGKIPVNVRSLGVDMLSASAHKIHGPKGIGFLYCKKGLHITPLITGGGQERGLRSGTEAVPLIAGFEGAIKELPNITATADKTAELNSYARDAFRQSGFIEINSPENACPYILNISVPGYRSETLLHFLEMRNIFVSSGSACAKGELSYVLKALGLDKARIDSALRLSFSRNNTKEDIDLTLAALKDAVVSLRKNKI